MAASTLVLILYMHLFMVMNRCLTESSLLTGAPTPGVDCPTLMLSMLDCMAYSNTGSTMKKPEATCCAGLKTVLKTDSKCLCDTYKNSLQLGLGVNVTKALSLPSDCHINAPSAINCGLKLGRPVQAPMAVGEAPTMAGTGPLTTLVPATPSQSSGSSWLHMSTILFFVSMLLYVYVLDLVRK